MAAISARASHQLDAAPMPPDCTVVGDALEQAGDVARRV